MVRAACSRGLHHPRHLRHHIRDVEEICPDAWLINFTNPAGMVTEAVHRRTHFRRFIGVCNIPVGMQMFVRDALKVSAEDSLSIDIFGLNHLVFIGDVLVNGVSRFDELLEGVMGSSLTSASSVKNIFDLPFDASLMRGLRPLPCSYLRYYFKEKEMLGIEMGEFYKGGARAQVVRQVEKRCLSSTKGPELKREAQGWAARRRLLLGCGLRGNQRHP